MRHKKRLKKSRIRSLQKRSAKQKRRRKRWVKSKNKKGVSILHRFLSRNISLAQKQKTPYKITTPANFSLIDNPSELLTFFNIVGEYLRKKVEVVLDFQDIQKVSSDAIILLIAKISNNRYCNNTKIYGLRPKNLDLDKIFFESGFYKLVGIDKRKPTQGLIHTKRSTIVDRQIATEARKLAANKTFLNDDHIKPLYRTLIECMANTKQHARGKGSGSETWWLAVYHDSSTGITSFSFIDTGVGIFKSAKIKKITKLAVKLGFRSNTQILWDILNGQIKSSTGLNYRGKGLPKIHSDFKNGNLANLHIITNNVFAKLQTNTVIELNKPLIGTFIYWEILPQQKNNINGNHIGSNSNS